MKQSWYGWSLATGMAVAFCSPMTVAQAQSSTQQNSDRLFLGQATHVAHAPVQKPAAKAPDVPSMTNGDPYDRIGPMEGTKPGPAVPAPVPETPIFPASFTDWLKQGTMTGDWGGLRTRLQNEGIALQGHYLEDSSGNPVGGQSKNVRYAHEVGLGADINFAKLTGYDFGVLHILVTERAGLGLTPKLPVLDSVQEIFGSGETVRLTRLSLEKQLSKYADVELGWINTENDFGQSTMHWGMNIYCQFQNNGICGMPQSLAINSGYGFYPTAHPGAYLKLYPAGNDRYLVSAGIYNVDPSIPNTHNGFKLGLQSSTGVYLPFQLGWHGGGTDVSGAYPTNLKIGGYWDTSEVNNVYSQLAGFQPKGAQLGTLPIEKVRGRYGGWFEGDQMIERDASDPNRGTVLFASFIWGDPRTSMAPYFLTWGLVRKGTLWNRPNDTISLGGKVLFVNGKLTNYVAQIEKNGTTGVVKPSQEPQIEFNYGWRPSPWLTVRPGVQYVWHPGGTNMYKNALVLDMECGVTF